MILGLGWTSEERDTHSGSWVHSDNVVGNTSSLSDQRVKADVSSLDPSLCLDFCNALRPAMYLQTLANEPRSGLIAQEVQAALEAHSLPQAPVLDTKMASVDEGSPAEELLALRYERLVPMLLGRCRS